MKVEKQLVSFVIIVSIAGVLLYLGLGSRWATRTFETESSISDRCRFLKGEGDMQYLSELQERETYGYPEIISLQRALEIFNEEQKCYPHQSEPLTEDEVVASISAGGDYGSESTFAAHRSDLLLIAQERKMPRGALLVSSANGIYSDRLLPGVVLVEGQKIYLFLGLDENPRQSEPLKDEQILMIRKKFVKTDR